MLFAAKSSCSAWAKRVLSINSNDGSRYTNAIWGGRGAQKESSDGNATPELC
jgi:hypothetical protein